MYIHKGLRDLGSLSNDIVDESKIILNLDCFSLENRSLSLLSIFWENGIGSIGSRLDVLSLSPERKGECANPSQTPQRGGGSNSSRVCLGYDDEWLCFVCGKGHEGARSVCICCRIALGS